MDRRERFAISKRDWRNAKPITSDWPQGAADADGVALGVAKRRLPFNDYRTIKRQRPAIREALEVAGLVVKVIQKSPLRIAGFPRGSTGLTGVKRSSVSVAHEMG
jgi:hypothetical protein